MFNRNCKILKVNEILAFINCNKMFIFVNVVNAEITTTYKYGNVPSSKYYKLGGLRNLQVQKFHNVPKLNNTITCDPGGQAVWRMDGSL